MIRLLSLGDGVPRLVEQNVPGLRRFLYICGETVKVFNGSGVNLVDNIVVENQPETVALHYGDVVTPEKSDILYEGVRLQSKIVYFMHLIR